jgi:glycosyltransferase involved in cell wall biosynthesis
MLGAWLAHRLRLPLVMSWHTNLHQYANLRCQKYFRRFPPRWAQQLEETTEQSALRAAARFYQVADLVLAPNQEILTTLTRLTGKAGRLMPHGVDCDRFQPRPRELVDAHQNRAFTIGYVGRLTPEKNVHVLVDLEAELISRGISNIRFVIVGEGSEKASLAQRMTRAVFCGVLRDEALAEAYRQMDLFVFPSRSDTLGLVLLEAMAAGLPVIAFRTSGPCAVVRDGSTGFVVETVTEMAAVISRLAMDQPLRLSVGNLARLEALQFSWDTVFASCYEAYMAAREGCSRCGATVPRGKPV